MSNMSPAFEAYLKNTVTKLFFLQLSSILPVVIKISLWCTIAMHQVSTSLKFFLSNLFICQKLSFVLQTCFRIRKCSWKRFHCIILKLMLIIMTVELRTTLKMLHKEFEIPFSFFFKSILFFMRTVFWSIGFELQVTLNNDTEFCYHNIVT